MIGAGVPLGVKNPYPKIIFEVVAQLLEGRDVRQRFRALGARYRQRIHLPGANMRQCDRCRRHEEIDIAAQYGGNGGTAAVGRQMPHLQIAGRLGEQHSRNVRRAVETRRTVDQLVRIGFASATRSFSALYGRSLLTIITIGSATMRASGMKSALVNFGCAAEQFIDCREAGNRHDVGEQRVAVGLGGGDILRADCASRSGLVFEHDWLLENGLKRGVQRTGYGIADAARRKRTDHRNGPRRISVLRNCWTELASVAAVAAVPTTKLRRSIFAPPPLLMPVKPGLSFKRAVAHPCTRPIDFTASSDRVPSMSQNFGKSGPSR